MSRSPPVNAVEPGNGTQAAALPADSGRPSLLSRFKQMNPARRGRLVTLSLDDGRVRVVAFKRRRVVAWWTANLDGRPSIETETFAAQDGEGLQRLLPFLGDLQIPPGRIVTDLPLMAPLLRRLRLPKIGRRYLEQVVVSEMLEGIPLPPEDVDVAWQVTAKSGLGRDVLAMAMARKTLDSHIGSLRQVGMQPGGAYPRALALALACPQADAVLIHLGPSLAEIVLVRQRTPLAVYQMALATEGKELKELARALAWTVRMVAGYRRPLDSSESELPLPVVFTGLVKNHAALVEALPGALDWEIAPFAPSFEYPAGFDREEYAVNLGLALADSARGRSRTRPRRGPATALNVMPARHLPKPLPVTPIAVFLALTLFAITAFNLGQHVDELRAESAALSVLLESQERQERQQRLASLRATVLERSIQATAGTAQALGSQVEGLQGDTQVLLDRLGTVASSAASGNVSLSTVATQGANLILSGTARAYEDVLRYAADLRGTGAFAGVAIVRMDTPGDTGDQAGQSTSQLITFQARAAIPLAQETGTRAAQQ